MKVVAHRADGAAGGDVRQLALDVRGRLPGRGARGRGRGRASPTARSPSWRRSTTRRATRGLSANALVRAVGPLVGGKGGGKDDVAQGGGTDASRVDEALALVETEVGRAVQA